MLIKDTNNVRLTVEKKSVQVPEGYTHLIIQREFLDDKGESVTNKTFFELFLTDEELAKLKSAL